MDIERVDCREPSHVAGAGSDGKPEPTSIVRVRSRTCLERLRGEILAIERRGAGEGEDDPQARRWFIEARRLNGVPDDLNEQGRRGDSVHPCGHSLQEPPAPAPSPAELHSRYPARDAPCLATGWPEIDASLGGFPLGGIHELFGVEWADPPPYEATVRGGSRRPPGFVPRGDRRSPWIPPMGVAIRLASLALREIGGGCPSPCRRDLPHRGILWIGRAIRPDADALCTPSDPRAPGASDASRVNSALAIRSFFLDPVETIPPGDSGGESRAESLRVWAIEQAIRHEGFAAIIADGRGLTPAESRRLQVATAGRGLPSLVLLLREPREIASRSISAFRWRVEPYPWDRDTADSGGLTRPCGTDGGPERGFEGGLPGGAGAWRLRLLRGRTSLTARVRGEIESDRGLVTRVGMDAWAHARLDRWRSAADRHPSHRSASDRAGDVRPFGAATARSRRSCAG